MNLTTLQQYLESASEAYYKGHPTIPDEVFDTLTENLKNLKVGYRGEKAKHLYPLYSLEKFYVGETPPNRKFLEPITTPKLDGANISAQYVSGFLIKVLTRGDGEYGQDISEKFLDPRFNSFPERIDSLEPIQITFEIVAEKTIENARNYCAGALNLKSLDEFFTRKLSYIVHTVQGLSVGRKFTDQMRYLHDQGFDTILCNIDFDKYPQDGKVVRENSLSEFERWGYTQHHPRGAYAIKERVAGVITTLREVTWQVGKSGKVTPLAHFDTVVIDDANISKATLHNIAFIETMGLDIGDRIEVQRMGGIIPGVARKVVD